MDGASSFDKGDQRRRTKNLYSIVSPAGTAKVGCEKNKIGFLSIWKGAPKEPLQTGQNFLLA